MSAITLSALLLFAQIVVVATWLRDADSVGETFYSICKIAKSDNLPSSWFYESRQRINVTVNVTLLRFIEISDLDQRLSLFLDIRTEWTLPCNNVTALCSATDNDSDEDGDTTSLLPTSATKPLLTADNTPCPNGEEFANFVFFKEKDRIWHVFLSHQNAATKAWDIAEGIDNSITVYPFSKKSSWVFRGRLDNACTEFSFAKFPFDTLKCSIILESMESARFLNYEIGKFEIDKSAVADFIGDTEIWELINPLTWKIENVTHSDGLAYHRLLFTMQYKRRHTYFIGNIFLPTYALFLLQIAAIIMPARYPDRPTYCMAAVLAFSFILSMVYGSIPKTSEVVYVIQLIMIKLACGVAITIYTLVTCALATKHSKVHRKLCCRISVIRAMDLAFSLTIIGIVLVANYIYLGAMMS